MPYTADKTYSTTKQRQQIGYLRKQIGLDEDTYREMLMNEFGVKSCKDLSMKQAGIFLNKLRDYGRQTGTFIPKKQYSFQKYKYHNLGEREPHMATANQLRMIEALWYKVSYQKTDKDRAEALEKMIERITGKQKIVFLTKSDVSKVIKVFRTMGEG